MFENNDYLTKQIITYIGNKRSLLNFIVGGLTHVQKKLQKQKLDIFDVFSGSGIVARRFKQYANLLIVNDLERYSKVINECYLSNVEEIDIAYLKSLYESLMQKIAHEPLKAGIITEFYAPEDDRNIKRGERVFYTKRNAMYIDTMRLNIEAIDGSFRKYFLAPLLSEASIHTNTAGVFKGFYKNKATGIGQFGGTNKDALLRIKGDIAMPFPLFSNFNCEVLIYNDDSNKIVKEAPQVDLAYIDPPYNQHPYGANYFMLNLIVNNTYPKHISSVSGIQRDWNRSAYNKKRCALKALSSLVRDIKAKYVLLSFNSEGFIKLNEIKYMMQNLGKLEFLEIRYPTFRGCRNLGKRNINVTEYLYLLEKY